MQAPILLLIVSAICVGCASPKSARPDPVFPSCAAAVRAVELGRVAGVFTNQRCGRNYVSFKAFASTPAGKRCHIGYTCYAVERPDPL
ncbi:MAG: hypothetical protein ACI8PT_000424 [Gammaproteobacteria bacterium]|jgi:hypothetical protein